MTNRASRRLLGLTVALVAAGWLPACSKAAVSTAKGAADGVTATDVPTPMVIETTPSAVIIDNRVGRRLIGVRITIDVAESEAPFILVVPTIEKETKGRFELTSFRSEEAALLDPTAVHPKQVNVRARDSLGKAHEVTVPWTP